MSNCSRCGGKPPVSRPVTYKSVTILTVDGTMAWVQFRYKVSFYLNDTLLTFLGSELKRLDYTVIVAALAAYPGCVIFINPAEKADFAQKHPEVSVD